MRVIRCPHCNKPLPWIAHYCPRCGQVAFVEHAATNDQDTALTLQKTARRKRPRSLNVPTFYAMQVDPDETQHLNPPRLVRAARAIEMQRQTRPVPLSENDRIAQQRIEELLSENDAGDELQYRATWKKVVTRPIAVMTPPAPQAPPVTTRPASPPQTPLPLLLPGALTPFTPGEPVPVAWAKQTRRSPAFPRATTWIAALVLFALVLGGAFGVYITLGRNASPNPALDAVTLLAEPATIAPGGVVVLHGAHFTPDGEVGLTRDASIPVLDTSGLSITHADTLGAFQDTISIDSSWTTGTHILRAEDAHTHKSASFTIQVDGKSLSLRPPHLLANASSINLGSGDQATNSTQTLILSNAGGGQIGWQATATQSWLMLSPSSGIIAQGQPASITLAADRSSLQVGTHQAKILFTSNAGDITLPVTMQVTPLLPGHEAVLQVTPAVLSFNGVDGSASLVSQTVTISNPGVLPLNWGASSATSDGSSWLTVSPASGSIKKGNSQPVSVLVDSSLLLPGVYYGSVTFASQGTAPTQNSPQTVYVSVTIAPQCTIQILPGSLTFAGVYLQPGPVAKSISVGVNQSCAAPLAWSVSASTSSGGHWLTVSAASGVTPATPTIGVVPTGLLPGTYSGQLLFSSPAGTQTVPVAFIMGKPTTPILTSSVGVLSVNGIAGQPAPTPQIIVLSNTGGGTLSWSATATTTVGGAWLSVTPAKGILAALQVANLSVQATVLPAMIPGVYTGTITLTGKDSTNHPAAGSPQSIPVTFTVQAPCSVAASVPALAFLGAIGQLAPPAQPLTISASSACANALAWTATVATIPAGGTWLTTTPASGTVTTAAPASSAVGVALTGLAIGTYNGSVTIAAIDSVTHLPVGTPQVVAVTLTVQPSCTLLAPSSITEAFSSEVGLNPVAQTFTIGVTGACTGMVTITPTATTTSGGAWLAIGPASATVASGGTATFTVTVTSAALASGTYAGAISLAAVNGSGVAITGSPQAISASLQVLAPPALTSSPASLSFTQATGSSSQTITLNNTGGEPLNWTAALASGSPSYVTITSLASGTLAAGATTTVTITVNTTGLAGSTTATTSVTVSATDPLSGAVVAGSPASTGITVTVPPPAMQLSLTTLNVTTTQGTNPTPPSISITNTGGGSLSWTAGSPSQAWLTVAPATGTDAAGASSTMTFTINVTGLATGTYSATVLITPSSGVAQTVTVNLTIN